MNKDKWELVFLLILILLVAKIFGFALWGGMPALEQGQAYISSSVSS